ncbi:hypothetical protein KJ953_04870 [Patescibacteria group bacterium]|nr:hypothetical protein [Patescibacteria group bacterium]MBU1256241.1 hypothetical protein [Patescibacteria group bacterium]MBU1457257.1 hypothetical protein [Patescibacteria group bacterium]
MKKLNSHQVKNRLISLNLKIFTTDDLKAMFNTTQRATQAFLSYNVKKGVFVRLKAGIYALKDNSPSEFSIANHLYSPSYISLDSALSYYQLIPETIYAISSVTTKATREFKVGNLLFDYRRIKKSAYTGYVPKVIAQETIFIATPEKAVADFLYYVFLGKRNYNDRLKTKTLDFVQLKKYLKLFLKPKLISFASQLLNHRL